MKTNTIRTDQIRIVKILLGSVALALAIAATLAAGQVFEGNLTLNTQDEVDNFPYSEVSGTLRIELTAITNLDGLSSLTAVGGNMYIDFNDSLTSLDGLNRLSSVGGYLYIVRNDSLTNVDGLCSLTSVGKYVYIVANDSLTDVDGLYNLTSVGISLYIYSNDSLTNLDGLSGLMSVGYYLGIFHNGSLTDVDGLSNLTSVGYLFIHSNGSLTEFCGLYPVLHVGGLWYGYFIFDNAANPTPGEILDAGPCDPADTIEKLFAEHAINKIEARALLQLSDDSLEDLADLLTVFVEGGTLKPSEAQLLYVIASNWQAAD